MRNACILRCISLDNVLYEACNQFSNLNDVRLSCPYKPRGTLAIPVTTQHAVVPHNLATVVALVDRPIEHCIVAQVCKRLLDCTAEGAVAWNTTFKHLLLVYACCRPLQLIG